MARILASAGKAAETVVRAQVRALGANLIERSPVDLGQFKGNWQYGNDTINTDTNSPFDKTGESAMGRIKVGLASWKAGQTIWITNSLPYARVLEYGRANGTPGSMQAPNGMVRLAVLEFKNNVSNTAAGLQ